MFKSLKEFIENNLLKDSPESGQDNQHSLELAAAVLMLEIGLADSTLQSEERKVIEQAMQTNFHLSGEETGVLIALSEKEVDHAVSLYEFTSLLNRGLSIDERVAIIELLWQVAFADAVLDKYEEYYVRKIADLLYIPHKEYIRAKHKASSLPPE